MAFSTQKEFFHVPFMNEAVDYECRRACVKLKTYQSTIDDRSWAMDETLQSRFLSDLITCQTPVGGLGDSHGDGDDYNNEGDGAGTSAGAKSGRSGAGRGTGRGGGRGGAGRAREGPGNRVVDDSGYAAGAGMGADLLGAPSSGPSTAGLGGSGTGKEGRGGAPSSGGAGGGTGGKGPGGSKGGGMGGGAGAGGGGRFGQGGLVTADSVIACATEHLGRFEELLSNKKNLEKKLEVSNERLKVLNMENEKIKAIMNNKFDSNHAKDFYNKIQKLTSSGKISKGEENDLLQIYNKFEDMNKAYEILQAENAYLKRLMEKLSLRASYEAIKMEPEKSNDIGFLQKEVNKLRQEVTMLRKFEDEKLKGSLDSNRNKMTDQDAETLKAIVKERNALREKCKTIKELEGKVHELQMMAREADKMSDSLSSHLDRESRRVVDMENEIKEMQDYYEEQISKWRFNEDLLKCQLDAMKEDLIRATCAAQKADLLEMDNSCLRNELMRRDNRLNEYDCQYKQLMKVIDELQGNAIQNLHDTQTQTCTDYMDDLTFFARATISEIRKELKKRGADGDKIGGGFFGGTAITDGISPDECCAELRRMQDIVRKLTQENEFLQNKVQNTAEELCADTLNKLKEMEERYKNANDEIRNLKKDKDALNMKAMEKLNEFSERVDKLDVDVSKTAKDTSGMDKDLKESIKLVQDISDMQLKNAHLTNAVNAISTRDDQKALDDLRRQLLEEQAKNKECQEDNTKLREALVKRGIEPDKEIGKEAPRVGFDRAPKVEPETTVPEAAKKGGAVVQETGGADVAKKGDTGPTGAGATKAGETTDAAKKPGADGPDVGKKAETGPTGADQTKAGGPDAAKKGEPGPGADGAKDAGDADEKGAPDAAKKGGAGAPDAAKKAEPDVAKKGEPEAAKKGEPEAAKKGGPEATKKGEPEAAKKGEPEAAKKGEPEAAKKGEPEAAKKGEPEAAKKGEPEAAKKGEPEATAKKDIPAAGQAGGTDAAKKDGPGAGVQDAAKRDGPGAGGPDAAKKDEPGAGVPDAAKKDEPGVGEVGGADAGKKGGPDVSEVGQPEAAKKVVPDAGEPRVPDAAKKDEPGGGATGTRDPGAQVAGPSDGPVSVGPDLGTDGDDRAGLGPDGKAGGGYTAVGRDAGDRTGPGKGVGGGGAGHGAGKIGGPASGTGKTGRPKDSDGPADDAFQQFVDSNANAMMTNIKAGSGLEKELRAILNAFMMECGFCFCKSLVPKSKFYALCHKLLHNGIQCMAFRELAYLHRKIFMAADKLHPGCLLNMILTERGFKDGETFKCCSCKNALCCSNSEEMLKEKVYKLERDIEMAKEYLDSLKTQPKSPNSSYTVRGKTYRQMEDSYSEAVEELLTCREAKPALSRSHSKQMKTLKARIIKCSELLR